MAGEEEVGPVGVGEGAGSGAESNAWAPGGRGIYFWWVVIFLAFY